MKPFIYIFTLIVFAMSACTSSNIVRYTIASQKGDCIGEAPQRCMLVKEGTATDWQYFYSHINGFDYTEGYEYVIDVKKAKVTNPAADASSIEYTMTKQISRTAKTSAGLPNTQTANLQTYQLTGTVLSIEQVNTGRGAAAGKFSATLVEVRVSSSVNKDIKQGDIIHCELVAKPHVSPVLDREYVFNAKYAHPAHAKGVYLLETDVRDLI